ncbi:MAG: portal protein, partial [Candidatus Thorarchaeota archaeon]
MDNNVANEKFKGSSLAKEVYDQWERYRSDRQAWAKQAAEDEDFFLGKHYTDNEVLEMKLKGMAPVVVDKVNPIIMQEVAIFTATRPSYRALPRGDGDVKLAGLWSDVLAWMWYDSNCDSEYLQCITKYFAVGAGYMFVGVDPYGDDGDGRIYTINMPIWDVYPDPHSRKIDLSDARSIFISRVVPKSSLEFSYPDQGSKINKAEEDFGSVEDKPLVNKLPEDGTSGYGFSQNDYSFTDMDDDLIRVTEMYEKIRVPFWKVFDNNTGQINIYRADQFNAPKETNENQRFMKIWRTRVRVTSIMGSSVLLYRSILPTDIYPIVPFFLHHNGTPWVRGDISIMKGQQRALNKSRSISMHNASQMSNFRWLAPRGSIHNRENWEERGAASGNILEYTQGFDKPEAVMPGQLPAAWFTLEQSEKQDIEYSVGVFGNMMGNA